ncbi:hypothetical protein Q7P37_010859 [Cladosporium fusiforme]
MSHTDRVKVILKPQGSNAEDPGFAEFDMPSVDDHDCSRQWVFTEYREGPFEIWLTVPPNLDMHGASALHIGFPYLDATNTKKNPRQSLDKLSTSTKHAKQVVNHTFRLASAKTLYMSKNKGIDGQPLNAIAHTDFEYDRDTDTRCITVTTQLGNPRWIDERDASVRGAKTNVNYSAGCFERLPGPEGRKLILEIYPQVKETEPTRAAPAPKKKVTKRRVLRVKKPNICKCPNPEKCAPAKNPRRPAADSGSIDESLANSRTRKPKKPRQSKETTDDATESPDEMPLSLERNAPICEQCREPKPAPKGRKIAWRQRRNAWMIVDTRAKDEEVEHEHEDEEEEEEEEEEQEEEYGEQPPPDQGVYEQPDDGYGSQEPEKRDDASKSQEVQNGSQQSNGSKEGDVNYDDRQATSPPLEPNQISQTPESDGSMLERLMEEPEKTPGQRRKSPSLPEGTGAAHQTRNDRFASALSLNTHQNENAGWGDGNNSIPTPESAQTGAQSATSIATPIQGEQGQQTLVGTANPQPSLPQEPSNRTPAQQNNESAHPPARPAESDESAIIKAENDAEIHLASRVLDAAEKDEDALREELEDIDIQENELQVKKRRQAQDFETQEMELQLKKRRLAQDIETEDSELQLKKRRLAQDIGTEDSELQLKKRRLATRRQIKQKLREKGDSQIRPIKIEEDD